MRDGGCRQPGIYANGHIRIDAHVERMCLQRLFDLTPCGG
jgi:hypothetical protein